MGIGAATFLRKSASTLSPKLNGSCTVSCLVDCFTGRGVEVIRLPLNEPLDLSFFSTDCLESVIHPFYY